MNSTFDIKRFGNVVRYDAMSYFQNFGWTLLVLLALPIGLWFLLYVNINELEATVGSQRYGFFYILMIIAMILAPSRLYKNCNDARKGMQFAMLPASSLEKFLSMLLFCIIVTPVLYMIGAVTIDTVLALIPGKNPYEGFVFKNIFHTYLVEIGNFDREMIITKLPFYQVFVLLSYTSIFMFTNMLFKKRKVSKTIGILALLGIIFMIISIRCFFYIEEYFIGYEGNFEGSIPDKYEEIIYKWVYYGYYVFNIIFTTLMLYLTYNKIRKQKY